MQLRKAQRQQAKMRIALAGPAGSGKTKSALRLAYGMTGDWTKIAVIDTERQSADLYSDMGDYNVYPLSAPYTPEAYIKAIKECEDAGMEVIIPDSISHEWEGAGGIMDILDHMTGNSFTNWAKVTPRHNEFIDKMLNSPCHIVATIRTKQDYVLVEKNGKMAPEKVGLKAITREGIDYEFTLVFDIDIKHNAKSSKDRTQLFMDKPEFMITEDTGKQIMIWANGGAEAAPQMRKLSDAAFNQFLARIAEPGLYEKTVAQYEFTQEQRIAVAKARSTDGAATTPAPQSTEPDPDDIMAALDRATKIQAENGQAPQPEVPFIAPTGQQIAVIKSLLLNPLFSEEERAQYETALPKKSKEQCQAIIDRLPRVIMERQQAQAHAA